MHAEKTLPHIYLRSSYDRQAINGKSFALKEVSKSCSSLRALFPKSESLIYVHSAVAEPYPVHYLMLFLSIDLKINFASSKMKLSLTF